MIGILHSAPNLRSKERHLSAQSLVAFGVERAFASMRAQAPVQLEVLLRAPTR